MTNTLFLHKVSAVGDRLTLPFCADIPNVLRHPQLRAAVTIAAVCTLISACTGLHTSTDPVETEHTKAICRQYPTFVGYFACREDQTRLARAPWQCDAWARLILECKQFGTNCAAAQDPPLQRLRSCRYE